MSISLTGNKKQRQFSTNFHDLSKNSVKNMLSFLELVLSVSESDEEGLQDFISFEIEYFF